MIQFGLVDEGLEVVRAIRDRYDGEKRNPWNEIECGSNYARSMASYALLLAFSGFQFDMARGSIGFNPIAGSPDGFQTFWSLASAWGMYRQDPGSIRIEVLYGALNLEEIVLPFLAKGEVTSVCLNGQPVQFKQTGNEVVFGQPVQIRKDDFLVINRI